VLNYEKKWCGKFAGKPNSAVMQAVGLQEREAGDEMGYREHHAIIVTATYENWIEKAHNQASKIFKWVSPISPFLGGNQCRSFFIPPDAAELATDSHEGDRRRDEFIEWLEDQKYEDGSSPLQWAEVQYGDTRPEEPMVCRHD